MLYAYEDTHDSKITDMEIFAFNTNIIEGKEVLSNPSFRRNTHSRREKMTSHRRLCDVICVLESACGIQSITLAGIF